MTLIERLEALTGPDREADLEVWWAVKANNPSGRPMDPDYKAQNLKMNDAPRYTASLDAALTLVPAGMEFEISNIYGIVRCTMGLNNNGEQFHSERKDCNWPIALTIAALKARSVK